MLLRGCSLIFQGDPGEDGRAVSFSVFTLKYCYKRRVIYRFFQIDRLKYYHCNLGFFCFCFQGPPGLQGVPGIPGVPGAKGEKVPYLSHLFKEDTWLYVV